VRLHVDLRPRTKSRNDMRCLHPSDHIPVSVNPSPHLYRDLLTYISTSKLPTDSNRGMTKRYTRHMTFGPRPSGSWPWPSG
jgi:hypothetical protein